MTRNAYILIGIFVIAVGVFIFLNPPVRTEEPASNSQAGQSIGITNELAPFGLSLPLFSQVDSSPEGGVDLVEIEGQIKVRIVLRDTSTGVSRPAHLHSGSCNALGGIVFPLNPVVDGSSETTLSISGEEFQNSLPLVLNVHKSADELNVSVTCEVVASK